MNGNDDTNNDNNDSTIEEAAGTDQDLTEDYTYDEEYAVDQHPIRHMTVETPTDEDDSSFTPEFARPEKEGKNRMVIPIRATAMKAKFKCSGYNVWRNFSGTHSDTPRLANGYDRPVPATALPSGVIDIEVLKDLNKESYLPNSRIKSVRFHRSASLAMVAESYGTISFTEINKDDGNKPLKSLLFNETKLSSVMFVGDGDEAFIGSLADKSDYFYDLTTNIACRTSFDDYDTKWDAKTFSVSPNGAWVSMSGNQSEITIMSVKEKRKIFKVNSGQKSRIHSYSLNGQFIYTHGVKEDCTRMQVVDLRQGQTLHECRFEKGTLGHVPATQSPNGRWIAFGGLKGRISIFATQDIETNRFPLPIMTIDNFDTPVTSLRFSKNSEILAFASNRVPSAFQMLHMNSYSLFHNFQHHSVVRFKNKTNVTDIDFSPHAGYMAIGNASGRAHLYRLPHYDEF
ncbi:U3 small nucleolar RNA-associated protein 18 homolog [Trichogramma pretiosum]|uniref:U3 small nucleolar RNA-associated protein 18 homolog n=1 Tax=Trichogramma pretiosum TaxID=7493 RepID=UPI0006C9D251|nr:U3 small nucleolar RNA-associated protein 18 homolog [Trichogramma pretiosum]